MCLPSSCYAHVYTGDSQAAAPGAGLPRCLHQAWPGPSLAGVGVGEVEAGAGDNPFHECAWAQGQGGVQIFLSGESSGVGMGAAGRKKQSGWDPQAPAWGRRRGV